MNLPHARLFALLLVALTYGCATSNPPVVAGGAGASAATATALPEAGGAERAESRPGPGPVVVSGPEQPKPATAAAANEEPPPPADPPPPQDPVPTTPPELEPEPRPEVKPIAKPEAKPAVHPQAPGIYLQMPEGRSSVATGEKVNVRFVTAPGRRMQMDSLRMLVDGKDQTPTLRLVARVTTTGLHGITVSREIGMSPGTRRLLVSVKDSAGHPHQLNTEIVVRR